jgi:hypothetical protein
MVSLLLGLIIRTGGRRGQRRLLSGHRVSAPGLRVHVLKGTAVRRPQLLKAVRRTGASRGRRRAVKTGYIENHRCLARFSIRSW